MSMVSPYASGSPGYVAQRARSEAERNHRRSRRSGAEAAAAEEEGETTSVEEAEETEKAEESAAAESGQETAAGEEAAGSTEEPGSNPEDWEVVAESDPEDETKDSDKTDGSKETEKTEEQKKEESARLAAYKLNFLKKLNGLVAQPQFAATKVELKISDEGYARMMDDPAYEQKVLTMFRRDLGTSISFAPTSAVLTVDGKTENVSVDYSGKRSGYDRSRALLGTMSKPYLRGGLDILQSQVASVLQSRLGTSNLSNLTGSGYSKSGLFGGSIDTEG